MGRWIWLFPLTYVVHIVEEYGEDFTGWAVEFFPVRLTTGELLAWNLAGLVLMTAGVALAVLSRRWRWVVTAVAGIVLVNVLFHAIASAVTRTYSPGLISALLLWLPLGVVMLRKEWRGAARSTFWKGVTGVIVFHAALLVALSMM